MRTKNTVLIERQDMEATSQDCDFNVKAKQFLLRTHVKVLLKHFEVGAGTGGTATPAAPAPPTADVTSLPDNTPGPPPPAPSPGDQSILPSPGAYSDTNAAPLPSSGAMNK
jgi:hypothetical protein